MNNFALAILLAFPLLASAQATPAPESSGVQGTILITPVMGGPTRQGVADAKPLTNTEFVVKQGDRVIDSFRTDADGQFRISLGAGHYSVMRKGAASAMGFYGPFEVDVAEGKMKSVQWKCDSGIR